MATFNPDFRKDPSLRLLVQLEWLLLAMAAITIFVSRFENPNQLPIVNFMVLIGLVGMRLKLPKRRATKILYTGLEFLLIIFPFLINTSALPSSIFLCLVIVIRSCVIFDRVGRLIVAGIAFLCFVILVQSILPPSFRAIATETSQADLSVFLITLRFCSILMFGLVLIFVLLLINALLAERQKHQELMIANEQLQLYAQRIENQATLQERNRIAREIHDSLGHSLTAQSIQLENAHYFLQSNGEKAQKFLESSIQLGADALKSVRQSVATLRADPLRGKTLESELNSLLQNLHKTTGISPQLSFDIPPSLSTEVTAAAYRITQEAITNIIKHSSATSVTLSFHKQEDKLLIWIHDDGNGFNPSQNTTGFGIQGMRERALILGGEFHLLSQKGEGCQIKVLIPLSRVAL